MTRHEAEQLFDRAEAAARAHVQRLGLDVGSGRGAEVYEAVLAARLDTYFPGIPMFQVLDFIHGITPTQSSLPCRASIYLLMLRLWQKAGFAPYRPS